MENLLKFLIEQGYYQFKIIDKKICALSDYAYTTGIVVGIDSISYERRYCYAKRQDALQALQEYTSILEHPSGPWIKCKGIFEGQIVDLLNPNLKD